MELSRTVLIIISRLIGLSNLCYVPGRQRIELARGVHFVYCVVLHVVYLLLTPLIFLVMVHNFFECQDLDMLAMAYTVVALARVLSIVTLLFNMWLRRRQLQRVGNVLLRLLLRYYRYWGGYSFWSRNFVKLLSSCSRVVLLLHLLLGPNSAVMCGEDGVVTPVSPIYLVLTVGALLIELVMCGAIYWIYSLMALFNWLLECMAKETRGLAADVHWLPRGRGCHRAVYQQQLLAAWQHLWRCCSRMDALQQQLMRIYEWQLLFYLFSSYVTDITVVFNLVLYFNDESTVSFWRSLGYLIMCCSYHYDILKDFAVFESNRVQWMELLAHLQELWSVLGTVDIDWSRDSHCIAFYRQLEFALIFLNRKLQHRPERVRRLHVVGLFDMCRHSGRGLTASIMMNVLILWQIAYKYYY
ncbi:hypothetical protein KR222_003969 [Zaprionus bogoriensis]|nr:hypothetical protein KR222_003969 [Zaprionus bogoriensis]